MILSECFNLTSNSHKIIEVECDYKISQKCRNVWKCEFRQANISLSNNGNKILCIYCSRSIKSTGRKNPNAKYPLDDNFFENIDTKFKAYLLGIIASDGAMGKNAISVHLHKKDIDCIQFIKKNLCKELPIKNKKGLFGISVCSKKMQEDVCKHLKLKTYGKKAYTIQFPELDSSELDDAFTLGYFDGDGSISNPYQRTIKSPVCALSSMSHYLLLQIKEKYKKFNPKLNGRGVWFYSINCLDFLYKLYNNFEYGMERKKRLWSLWNNWQPSIKGYCRSGDLEHFKFCKLRKDAIPPSKERASDSGYDLSILELKEKIGNVEIYHTGIKVSAIQGWYFDLVPRSSIIKTGYILANSVGIIDRGYTGEILIPLIKMDAKANLELPKKIAQLIPRQIIHCEMKEYESLEETNRLSQGFGSTGK